MSQSVVIVGGGVMGAATACFLARDHGVAATVLERDPTYRRASSALSASSIRQQFSNAVNIALSRESLAFYRRIGDELAVNGERPHIGLVEAGYLYLAGDADAPLMRELHALQRAHGADVALLDAAALQQRFPWLSCEGIALGSLGESGEGWFDGWSVLQAFRRKAIGCGARFVHAEAVTLEPHAVRCADGSRHTADAIVLAAGAWAATLLQPLGVDLPVRARKRDVFVFESPAVLPGCPLIIDPSGVWCRPTGHEGARRVARGSGFICGAPPRGEDIDDAPLEHIDHALFDEHIWPVLARRVPSFEALRVTSAWAGYYEMNLFDHNGLVGALPQWPNLYLACGFSGHGMQQAPAVGRALAMRLANGEWPSAEIEALSPVRVWRQQPLIERNVI
jgi:FAD-dependent oxidoreductase domain-containing protein 1